MIRLQTSFANHVYTTPIFAAVLVLVACVHRSAPAQTPPTPKQDSFINAIAIMKHSIAPVVCVQPIPGGGLDLRSIEGSAFFVSADGSFITANHVLNGLTEPGRQMSCPVSAIYAPIDSAWRIDTTHLKVRFAVFRPENCARNARLDLAFCTVVPGGMTLPDGTELKVTPVEFEETAPPDGTPVAFSGFPLDNGTPLSGIGFVAGYQVDNDLGTFTMVIDRTSWPGASGSPIYLQNGHVVGIVLARGIGAGNGLALGRIARFVHDVIPGQTKTQVKPPK